MTATTAATIRRTLDTVRFCATPTGDTRPIPGERPATAPIAAAIAAAEAEPFQRLAAAIDAYFADLTAAEALAEDEPAAIPAIERIIGEHVRAAQSRLHMPTPVIDWTDHVALTSALPTIARRAADLRFTEILG